MNDLTTSTAGKPRSRASQEMGWTKIHEKAIRILKERPEDDLVSLLADLREVDISRANPSTFYRTRDIARPVGEKIVTSAGLDVNDDFYYPDVTPEGYGISTISKVRYLSNLIRPDTTAVVEVGSGWSSNLFQIYLAHGVTRSKKVIYYGGEYTTAGIKCARFLAERDPRLKYKGFRFDYRAPDVSFLSKQKGHILFFTSHSIEQVEDISPALFDQLASMDSPVTLAHFEPVGWQRRPDLVEKRYTNDKDYFESIGRSAQDGHINPVVENAAWWSWRLKYNRNLIGILDGLQSKGTIKEVRKVYDYHGVGNFFNPTTLLHYEFAR